MQDNKLVAVVHRLDDGNYSLWQLDMPESALDEIQQILDRYDTCGCSICGSVEDIIDELTKFPYKNGEV